MHSCFSVKFYRPQTKFAKVMFSQVSVCPQGGISQHVLGTGVYPSMHWAGVVSTRGVSAWGCIPERCYPGEGIWGTPPDQRQILWDTVNKRAVRIPMECILVKWTFNCLLENVSSFSGSMCSVVASPSDTCLKIRVPSKIPRFIENTKSIGVSLLNKL